MTDLETKITLSADDAGASAAFRRIEAHLEKMIASMEKFGRKTDDATRKQEGLARAALIKERAEEQRIKNERLTTNSARNAKINDANVDTRIATNKKKIVQSEIVSTKKKNDLAKVAVDTQEKLGKARIKEVELLGETKRKNLDNINVERVGSNQKLSALKQENQLTKNTTTLNTKNTKELINHNNILKSNASVVRQNQSYAKARVNDQLGDAAVIGASVVAPSVMGTIFSLKQFAEDQNRRIGLKTEFGSDSEKIYQGLKQYAIQTSFTMDEAVVLARRANMTSDLGIDSAEKNLAAVKGIGSVLISSAVKSEDMYNATRQISQMLGRKTNVNVRQDVDPLIAAGLPIDAIITKFLQSGGDKSLNFEKKFANGGINNKLVFDAIMWYSKTQEVINANIDKQNALMNTYKSTIESLGFASVQVGKALDENLNITEKLKDAGDFLNNIDKSLEGSKINRSVAAFGASMVIGTTGAFVLQAILKRTAIAFGANAANVGKLGFAFKGLIPIVAGAYMMFGDWKGLTEDISKDGYLAAFAKHIDLVAASVIALTLAFKKNAVFMAAYGTIEAIKYVNSDEFTGAGGGADKVMDWAERMGGRGIRLATGDDTYLKSIKQEQQRTSMRIKENQARLNPQIPTKDDIFVNNAISITELKGGGYDVKTETTKGRSRPMDNAIIKPAL